MTPAFTSPAQGLLLTGTFRVEVTAHILASILVTSSLLRPLSSEKILKDSSTSSVGSKESRRPARNFFSFYHQGPPMSLFLWALVFLMALEL